MKDEERVTCEYMFGILGYSTWNLYQGKRPVAQLTLNEADRSFALSLFDEGYRPMQLPDISSWSGWMKWVRRNRHDPL
jgi:hypothetical protein